MKVLVTGNEGQFGLRLEELLPPGSSRPLRRMGNRGDIWQACELLERLLHLQ